MSNNVCQNPCFFYKMPALFKPQRLLWEPGIQTLMLTTFLLQQSFHTGYLPGNEFTIFCRQLSSQHQQWRQPQDSSWKHNFKKSFSTRRLSIRWNYISMKNLSGWKMPLPINLSIIIIYLLRLRRPFIASSYLMFMIECWDIFQRLHSNLV